MGNDTAPAAHRRPTASREGVADSGNQGRSAVRFSLDVLDARISERRDALQYCIRNDLL